MFCPNCGIENDEGSAFCKKCGAAMTSTTGEGTGGRPVPMPTISRGTNWLAQLRIDSRDMPQFILGIFSCILLLFHTIMAIVLSAIPEDADLGYFVGVFLMQVGVGMLGAATGIAGAAYTSSRFRIMCLSAAVCNILILFLAGVVIAAVAE